MTRIVIASDMYIEDLDTGRTLGRVGLEGKGLYHFIPYNSERAFSVEQEEGLCYLMKEINND